MTVPSSDENLPPLPEVPLPDSDSSSGLLTLGRDFVISLGTGAHTAVAKEIFKSKLPGSGAILGTAVTTEVFISQATGSSAAKAFVVTGITLALPGGIIEGAAVAQGVSKLYDIAATHVYNGAEYYFDKYYLTPKYGPIENSYTRLIKDNISGDLFSIEDGKYVRPNLLPIADYDHSCSVTSTDSLMSISAEGFNATVKSRGYKDHVEIQSSGMTKAQLIETSKELLNSKESGTSVKIEASDGTVNAHLLSKEFAEKANELFKNDIKLDSPDITPISAEGVDSYIVPSDQVVELKDGTSSTFDVIVDTINSAQAVAEQFIDGYMDEVKSLFGNEDDMAGLINDVNAGIQQGDAPEQIARTIAVKKAVKVLFEQGGSAIKTEIQQSLMSNPSDVAAIESGNYLEVSPEGVKALQNLESVTNSTPFKFGYNTAIAYATTLVLNANEGWDSQEYLEAAVRTTAQVATQMTVTAYLGKGAAGGGVGAAAAYLVSAGINDLFADDSMNSHQWQSTMVSAAVIGVATAIGVAIGGPIGGAIASVIVSQFMGGKEYGPGEYPDPYSYLKVIAKEDGSGNKIIGIESEGVVAIAREYYHDDLYGNSGSDNLVGKSGTNTIYGYGGNDHLEGRGDVDLLVGGEGDDEIFGGNGDDQLYGGEGNDNLFGGADDDTIVGGVGNDFIKGGSGKDQIMGEDGRDVIFGNQGNDTILGGDGDDIIDGGEGEDEILGEDGDDIILGAEGDDVIDGGAGIDIIDGGIGNDNIKGGDGNDEIYGREGTDMIYGDAGNDLINSGADDDLVLGGIGNDIIYGAEGNDSLHGEIGNDYVLGGLGDDTISGGAGDDVLFGGIGNDTITTGIGNDTIVFRQGDGEDVIDETKTVESFGIDAVGNDTIRFVDYTASQIILTKSGDDLVISFNDASGNLSSDQIRVTNQFLDTEIVKTIEFADGDKIDLTDLTINQDDSISYALTSYENIDTAIQEELVLGYNDTMQYQGDQENPDSSYSNDNYNSSGEQDQIDHELYNEMQWRSRKEKRNAFGGHYTVWYKYYEGNLSGTAGNDRIVGHWWSENIYGGIGDDQLHGGDGNDSLFGGAGDDILHGGAGNDNISGGTGDDSLYGGSGADNVNGDEGNDTIFGNSGADNINGGLGDDYLEGNDGDDTITDNEGNNILIAGAGFDHIITGAGDDKIEGNDGGDTIDARDGNNLVYGNGGNDYITTGSGNDTIYGQEGADFINAGAGDDYISGGADGDVINGEDGHDTIYGDLGIDIISGGAGNDYIYGGSGSDSISGDAGNDMIRAGSDDDHVTGGLGDDVIYGDSGSDTISGDEGNDIIDGGVSGDVLDGGLGDDIILGGMGNDILVDGYGSDTLDGGKDKDIIILTKEIGSSTSIDTVKNFTPAEDKIILKVSYKTPISFADLKSNMLQNGDDTEINLDNGQKLIIENTKISDLSSENFQIALSGGDNNDILFGTDGEDIIFGEGGDDEIYGGAGNDELWGGKGSDALYGEAGNDILRYEADSQYVQVSNVTYSDEIGRYWGYSHRYIHSAHYFNDSYRTFVYKPSNGYVENNVNTDDDVSIAGYDLVNLGESSRYIIPTSQSRVKNEGLPHSWYYGIVNVTLVNYNFQQSYHFQTKNSYTGGKADITGYNQSYDKFDGGSGDDVVLMTEGNDVLVLDGGSSEARLKDISVIHAGSGNDVINLSTTKYSYGDVTIYGGTGNDKIWSNAGNDNLYGGEGNDEIYGGDGDDKLSGGSGDDTLNGGDGDDVLEAGSGNNSLAGGSGDDLLIAGSGVDNITGGSGNDTVSYVNSAAAVSIDLRTSVDMTIEDNGGVVPPFMITSSVVRYARVASGGDAEGDLLHTVENVVGSDYDDTLIGKMGDNVLTGGLGNDTLDGRYGSDTYVYNLGDGVDTISEIGDDLDVIQFGKNISASDLAFSQDGNDFIIQVGASSSNKLILKDQLSGGARIEVLKFADGQELVLSEEFFLANEDEATKFLNPMAEDERQFSIAALFGSVVLDELTGEITYTANENFSGIDELIFTDEQGSETKYNIFVNPVNDTPFGEISDISLKVEETFTVNLSDYFTDIDGDALTYSIQLDGFNQLPGWINYDSETHILSGTSGRDGKLTFTATATDIYGAYVEDSFTIRITRNLIEDLKPTTNVKQHTGSDQADVIRAEKNSSDIIMAGGGDDVIEYVEDEVWIETSGLSYTAWNVYSGDEVSVVGKARSFDAFDGGDGYDVLNLTDQNDVMFLDDAIVSNLGEIAKITGIEEINAGLGDDVIDLTSLTFSYDDIVLNGGEGDDTLWSNAGNDTLNGEAGNDNLQGGAGNDILDGGEGDDTLKGYDGDDIIKGGSGMDIMIGGEGSDQFVFNNFGDSTRDQLDVILDFIQGDDVIDLSELGYASNDLSENGIEVTFENGDTIVEDTNSNFALKISGEISLDNNDFVF